MKGLGPCARVGLAAVLITSVFALWWSIHQARSGMSGSEVAVPAKKIAIATEQATEAVVDERVRLKAQLISLFREWQEETDPYRQNELQTQMEQLVARQNAGDVFRLLPRDLAAAPFGYRLLARWAAQDRSAALAWIETREPSQDQIATTVRGWLAVDETGAQRYVAALPVGFWKDEIAAALGNEATVRCNATEAVALLEQMQPGARQTRLLRSAAAKWAESDPAAYDWARNLEEGELQTAMVGAIARGYAVYDLKAAAEWAATLPPGPPAEDAIAMVVSVWREENTEDGLEKWIASIPDQHGQEIARHQLTLVPPLR